jgi:hypothetical protein
VFFLWLGPEKKCSLNFYVTGLVIAEKLKQREAVRNMYADWIILLKERLFLDHGSVL